MAGGLRVNIGGRRTGLSQLLTASVRGRGTIRGREKEDGERRGDGGAITFS